MHLYKIYKLIEKFFAFLQGKGSSATSIKQEVKLALSKVNNKSILAIDIGANIGNYTKALRTQKPNIEINLFEPSNLNFKKLQNIFSGDLSVKINNCGISNFECDSILYADKLGSGLASLSKRRLEHLNIEFSATEAIRLIKFENYWKEILNSRPIDLVKLDIEGHELAALEGFGEALAVTKVIQFEFGGCNIDTKTFFQDFWYFFKHHKFDLYRITPFGLQPLSKYSEMDECFRTTNFIAVNRN
jgi:FkbM family methyltransferase